MHDEMRATYDCLTISEYKSCIFSSHILYSETRTTFIICIIVKWNSLMHEHYISNDVTCTKNVHAHRKIYSTSSRKM